MSKFHIRIAGDKLYGWELWEGTRMVCEGSEKSACPEFTAILAKGALSAIVLSGQDVTVEMPKDKLPDNVVRLNDHR
jgi:hypothetical protein